MAVKMLTGYSPGTPFVERLGANGVPILVAREKADGDARAAAATASGTAQAGKYGGLGAAEAGRYGALAGLGGAMAQDNANRYGAYAAAEGNRQTAMANEAGSRVGAFGMAEAARQTALGNLGSSALGAYGSTANQALQAWSQNQMAYNNALAAMQTASQNSMSGLGQSRNAALGQLGSAYGDAGGRLGAASAAGDLSASFGGDFGGSGSTFNASNPGGTVAAGNTGGGFYGNINRSSQASSVPGVADATFAGMGQVGQSLMSPDIANNLMGNANRGLDDLNAQHYSSRMMPAQMQGQTFADMLMMGDQYLAPTMSGMNQFYESANASRPDFASGMNQFYDNMNAVQPDYSGILDPLTRPTSFSNVQAPAAYSPPPSMPTPSAPRPAPRPLPAMPAARKPSTQDKQQLVRNRTGMANLTGGLLDDWYRRLTTQR